MLMKDRTGTTPGLRRSACVRLDIYPVHSTDLRETLLFCYVRRSRTQMKKHRARARKEYNDAVRVSALYTGGTAENRCKAKCLFTRPFSRAWSHWCAASTLAMCAEMHRVCAPGASLSISGLGCDAFVGGFPVCPCALLFGLGDSTSLYLCSVTASLYVTYGIFNHALRFAHHWPRLIAPGSMFGTFPKSLRCNADKSLRKDSQQSAKVAVIE